MPLEERNPVTIDFTDQVSKTEQSHRQKVNINTIVAKYHRTGLVPRAASSPFYGDFTNVHDYQSSLDAVKHAEASFMSLPSELRNRFKNDPAQFLSHIQDPKNFDDCVELGIFVRPEPVPVEPEPTPETPE